MPTFTSAAELFKHVADQQKQITLVGMLKEGDSDATVMFAPTSCDDWITISANLIKSIEFLYETPCDDVAEGPHKHPVVKLILTEEASSAAPHLKVIEKLLREKYRADALQQPQGGRASPSGAANNMNPQGGQQRPQDMPPPAGFGGQIHPLVDCQYGYGSCGQWNPYFQVYCDRNRRPCFEANGYCWCKYFPECTY